MELLRLPRTHPPIEDDVAAKSRHRVAEPFSKQYFFYSKYGFAHHIRSELGQETRVPGDRLNSILQRLYVLFMAEKEQDDQKMQPELVWKNSEQRMQYLIACLKKELTHCDSLYYNRDCGALFRSRASLLIANDLQCNVSDLMPFAADFDDHGRRTVGRFSECR
jgi:hypothetical protein